MTQAPCNYDGVLTANPSGFTGPVELKCHFPDNSVITHTSTGNSDVLNNYSGGPVFVIAAGSGSGNNTAYCNFQGALLFNLMSIQLAQFAPHKEVQQLSTFQEVQCFLFINGRI